MTPPKEIELSSKMTLAEAKTWLRARFNDGADCPCCRQFVKLYKRTITGAMARGLIALHVQHKLHGWEHWMHIPTIMRSVCSSNMGSLLRHWELIEPMPDKERKDGSKRTGWYRITPLGICFVMDEVRVPRYVYLYNQTLLDRRVPADAPTLSITEALGIKFNYAELMGHMPKMTMTTAQPTSPKVGP